MVVKQDRSVEGIKDSLERLVEFFSGGAAHDADSATLLAMHRNLINLECKLQVFSSYRMKLSEKKC